MVPHTCMWAALTGLSNLLNDVRRGHEIGSGVVGIQGVVRDRYDKKKTLYFHIKFLKIC